MHFLENEKKYMYLPIKHKPCYPESGEDDLTYIWKLTGLDREVPIPWENRRSLRCTHLPLLWKILSLMD